MKPHDEDSFCARGGNGVSTLEHLRDLNTAAERERALRECLEAVRDAAVKALEVLGAA